MNSNCTVHQTADFLGKKWTIQILLEIYKGYSRTRRYQEIKNALPGITPKILSTRLKELEQERIIVKTVKTTNFPIKCEYSLTKSGEGFIHIIKDIKRWALVWKFDNKVCQQSDCKNCKL